MLYLALECIATRRSMVEVMIENELQKTNEESEAENLDEELITEDAMLRGEL